MQWYLKVMQNYVGFQGRATRKEYWMFYLFNAIISGILLGLMEVSDIFVIIAGIYALVTLLPSLAVSVRRLHDTGRSGWWMLIGFVPFGSIVILVFTCTASQPGDNQYGPNPKALS
jgi:uncharacterized membrane protein YhaH (DUF805 family)